jgi:hypothetical protein
MLAYTRSSGSSGALGLATNEIQRSLNGAMLGDVPNDFEAAVDLQYTPVRQGWYYGYPVTNPAPAGGLGQPTTVPTTEPTTGQLAMQILSTASITIMATLALFRVIHVARHGKSSPFSGDDR